MFTVVYLVLHVSFASVPCLRRAASIEEEYEAAGGEVLLDNEDNDGWLATHGKPKGMYGCSLVFIFLNEKISTLLVTKLLLLGSCLLCLENKNDEDDNLPSMDTLEISKKNTIQSISSYFGGEEEDIPDMAEFEEADNLVENDPVC